MVEGGVSRGGLAALGQVRGEGLSLRPWLLGWALPRLPPHPWECVPCTRGAAWV